MQGRVHLLPRVEGTGLGPSHGDRAVGPGNTGTLGSGTQGHRTQNMGHRHMALELRTWARGHRGAGRTTPSLC